METLTCYCNGTDNYGTYSFGITKEDYERLSNKYVFANDTYSALKTFKGKSNGKTYYSIKIKDGCPKQPINRRQIDSLKGKKVEIGCNPNQYSFKPEGGVSNVQGTSFTLISVEEVIDQPVLHRA